MSRGRPTIQIEKKSKWTLKSTNCGGEKIITKYDEKKNPNGPHSIEVIYPKGSRACKPKIEKRSYGGMPVYIVFKTSNRSNAKTKIKKFNYNIDYIITQDKLPGVPKSSIMLDMGVGESFLKTFSNKYLTN